MTIDLLCMSRGFESALLNDIMDILSKTWWFLIPMIILIYMGFSYSKAKREERMKADEMKKFEELHHKSESNGEDNK